MKLEAGNWFLDYKNHRNIYSLACSPWKEIKTYFDILKHLNFHTRLEHLEQMKKNKWMHTFQMMAITLLKNQVAEENVVFYTIMRLVRKGKLRNVNHLTNFKRRLYLRVVVGTALVFWSSELQKTNKQTFDTVKHCKSHCHGL